MGDGGYAFPCEVDTASLRPSQGMSLRDWFAGMALMGMHAADTPEASAGFSQFAKEAYIQADAMLEARKIKIPEGVG